LVADASDAVVRTERVPDDLGDRAEPGLRGGLPGRRFVPWIDLARQDGHGALGRRGSDRRLSGSHELVRRSIKMWHYETCESESGVCS
jgi:hypothetical protein